MSNEVKHRVAPIIGTEFDVAGTTYIVTSSDAKRLLARPKMERGKMIKPEHAAGAASIFEPEDWADEYTDGRQFLDPEPEDWGWRNGK
ncbi:MAG: hypothetical protein PHG91_13055 [Syntrophales bacterium]|nr:hypothetical protein [Syntrophales bacterium]MDD5234314.1 hypothetical protein [Syntrophales bacterium]MDD5533898.1 hypothetical protein [Syntrophales bacterium]HPL63094.1 hypothetical protein [Syntrophales bacterium]